MPNNWRKKYFVKNYLNAKLGQVFGILFKYELMSSCYNTGSDCDMLIAVTPSQQLRTVCTEHGRPRRTDTGSLH